MAGNASFITQDSNNNPIETELWLQSIQTSSEVQFDDNQIRKGISWRPIRRAEAYVNFTAIWSLQNFDLMNIFQDHLRTHHELLMSGNSAPMTLNYYENFLQFKGWVETIEKEYVRFKNVFIRNYRMNILLPDETWKAIETANTSGVIGSNYIKLFGVNWFSTPAEDPVSSFRVNPATGQIDPRSVNINGLPI